jgi:hypothetical protein
MEKVRTELKKISSRVSPRLGSVARVEQGLLGPSTSLDTRAHHRTEVQQVGEGVT